MRANSKVTSSEEYDERSQYRKSEYANLFHYRIKLLQHSANLANVGILAGDSNIISPGFYLDWFQIFDKF